MLTLNEHRVTRGSLGNDYEYIQEEWYLYDPKQYGKYTTVRQRTAIGSKQSNWKTYQREGMRHWEDNTTNRVKKKIIEEVKEWFDFNYIEWKTFNDEN
jgi:hypothetical protein